MSCGDTLLGCTTCGGNPCQCGQTVQASPSPYYNSAGCIQETHCQSITQQLFVASLSIASDIVMPVCNGTVAVKFTGLGGILIGSYMWNPTFGYLEVVGFDYLSGEVTLKNNCTDGNAAPGTLIPRCTLFNISPPPCECVPSPLSTSDWLEVDEVWTYASSTSINVPSNALTRFKIGDKIELVNVTTKYFYVAKVQATLLTVIPNNGITLVPGAISSIYLSRLELPIRFPSIFAVAPTFSPVAGLVFTPATYFQIYFSMQGALCTWLLFIRGATSGINGPTFQLNLPTNISAGLNFLKPIITDGGANTPLISKYSLVPGGSAALINRNLDVTTNWGLAASNKDFMGTFNWVAE